MTRLVHGRMVETLYEELVEEVRYAKESLIPLQALHGVYGQIKMAFQLGGIDEIEFTELNRLCVTTGINNPKYFNQ